MRDVYTKASQVVAWLGEEHPSDSGAMDFVDPNPSSNDSSTEDNARKFISLNAKLSSSFVSAKALIRRPWFSRAWIIQEAALARRLWVQCGNKTIDWERLYANLRLMNGLVDEETGEQVTFNNKHYQRMDFVNFTRRKIELDRTSARSPQNTDERFNGSSAWSQFHSAVVNARSHGASDRRDHIYALLGLVEEAVGVHLPVDYSRPYSAVFRDFTRCVIHQTGSLSALGQVDSTPSPDLESWVPDYGQTSHVDPLSSNDQPGFAASGDSKVRLIESDKIEVLGLSGILFDTIDEVAMGPNTDKDLVYTRSEMMINENADKIDPMEVVPKLAIRTIRRAFPQSKDILDQVSHTMGIPNDAKARPLDISASTERDATYTRTLNLLAKLSSGGAKEFESEQIREQVLGYFSLPLDQWRKASRARIFGPMQPSNDIYMKPALEEKWQRLARKCSPYPTENRIESAYWRTLIGNRRTIVAGNSDQPPEVWHDAYKVWNELLWEKEGMIPRLLHGRSVRSKELPTSGTTSGKSKNERHVADELQSDFRECQAELLKLRYDQRLRTSAGRATILTTIRMFPDPVASAALEHAVSNKTSVVKAKRIQANVHARNDSDLVVAPNKKPEGVEALCSGSADQVVDQVAGLVERYPDILPEEKDLLVEILYSLADEKAQTKEPTETLRAKISQAFRYDFFRVARNRKFCITKKRYMGWCPFHAKPGDRICILFGGQTPYIVRKEARGYRLLGEAYIHGAMNSEVLDMADIKIETIRLI
ncbi:MAG: hypothetical protein Q9183_002580 [Haloplaca sp. 2 TL-2023]